MLGMANITPEVHKQTTNDLRRAYDRRDNLLSGNTSTRSGAAVFIAALRADEAADLITRLTTVKAGVIAHRATLSA